MWHATVFFSRYGIFGNFFGRLQGVGFGPRGAHLAYLPHSSATGCYDGPKSRKIEESQAAVYDCRSIFDVITLCDFRVGIDSYRLPIAST